MTEITLFDRLVESAFEAAPDYAGLRPVIEKEILHYDILKGMNDEMIDRMIEVVRHVPCL
jgi:hypothetical protein